MIFLLMELADSSVKRASPVDFSSVKRVFICIIEDKSVSLR